MKAPWQIAGFVLTWVMDVCAVIEGIKIRWMLAEVDFWDMPLTLSTFIAMLAIDIYLLYMMKKTGDKEYYQTITKWYRTRIKEGWLDKVIFVVRVAMVWHWAHPIFAMYKITGIINGHLDWDR